MDLTWLDPDNLTERDLAGAVAVLEAAREADHPRMPGSTVSTYAARLRHGWVGDPPRAAVVRDPAGRVNALLTVGLPAFEALIHEIKVNSDEALTPYFKIPLADNDQRPVLPAPAVNGNSTNQMVRTPPTMVGDTGIEPVTSSV